MISEAPSNLKLHDSLILLPTYNMQAPQFSQSAIHISQTDSGLRSYPLVLARATCLGSCCFNPTTELNSPPQVLLC